MKVYVVYLLVATSGGPTYSPLESWRTWRECRDRALAFTIAALQHPKSNLLGADCREETA